MELRYKDTLNMSFIKEEGDIAIQILDRLLQDGKTVVTPEVVKEVIQDPNQNRTIADLTNRLNQAINNYDNSKKESASKDAIIEDMKTTIQNKLEEINSLKAKVRELETKPGEYSNAMADALKDNGLISEEEHNEITNQEIHNCPTNYWDNFTYTVDNYVRPLLSTPFGKYSVVNCTPHPVTVETPQGLFTFGAGDPTMVTRMVLDHVDAEIGDCDLPLVYESKGRIINMPERSTNTLFIVSRIIFDAATDREDLICPNVMKATRKDGMVVNVPSFICKRSLIEKEGE